MAYATTFWQARFTLPLGVLAIGVALSVTLGIAAHHETTRGAQQHFDAIATDVARKVEGRFDDYIAVLTGLRARFNTPAGVTRAEFRNYVAGLDLARKYPGFQAVNYAPYIAPGDIRLFERQMRADAVLDAGIGNDFAVK